LQGGRCVEDLGRKLRRLRALRLELREGLGLAAVVGLLEASGSSPEASSGRA
jgi:hypothetical protein